MHLVLDIDETLSHTQSIPYGELLLNHKYREYNSLISTFWLDKGYCLIRRPHLDTFLDFCFENFETVSVWTAGVDAYAYTVVDQLFGSRKPTAMWHRSMCREIAGYQYGKPLKDFAQALNVDTSRLVMIDDSCFKVAGGNAKLLNVKEWEPTPLTDVAADRELLDLISVLKSLLASSASGAS